MPPSSQGSNSSQMGRKIVENVWKIKKRIRNWQAQIDAQLESYATKME